VKSLTPADKKMGNFFDMFLAYDIGKRGQLRQYQDCSVSNSRDLWQDAATTKKVAG
jgi:hypothetical protein